MTSTTCDICGKPISARGRAMHLKSHAVRGETVASMARLRIAEQLVRQEQLQIAARRSSRIRRSLSRAARVRRGRRSGQSVGARR